MTNQTKFAVFAAVAAVALALLFSPLSSLLPHTAWMITAVALAAVAVGTGLLAIEAATNGMDARRKAKEEEIM